ncbi:MAG: hypothetical protein CM1200mP13_11840 [Candidatus Pelagibacterales bacterium]|nr:MAG: hypothetical protein CM1200mP13_11840 [Pelagibacterales bacterium]
MKLTPKFLKLNVLDQEVEIDFETSFNLNKDESYFLGIRPRSFEIPDHNSSNTFSGQVELVENMGAKGFNSYKNKRIQF